MAAEVEGQRKLPGGVEQTVGQSVGSFADQEVVPGELSGGTVALPADLPTVEDEGIIHRPDYAMPVRPFVKPGNNLCLPITSEAPKAKIMQLISSLAAVVAPVMLMTLLGFVWARRGLAFDHNFVTNLVMLVGAPCLVFSTLTRSTLDLSAMGRIAAAALACLVLAAAVSAGILKLAGLPNRVYLPSLMFPNIGNMGLPVCLFAFGETGLAMAMIMFAVTSAVQFTIGPAIAAGRLDVSGLFKVPFVYAVLLSLGVAGLGLALPQWLVNTVTLAAGSAIPLMLMSLGVALAELRAANLRRAVLLSALRLGLGAVVGWLVAVALGLEGAGRGVVIIESAMPVAVFNYLFAVRYDNRPEEVAGMILVSTVLSYLSLPLLVAALM